MKPGSWAGLMLMLAGQAWTMPAAADPGQGVLPPVSRHTVRSCPPHCVTPLSPHPDVRTVDAAELQRLQLSGKTLIIDVRRRGIIRQTGTIAGAVSVPFYETGLRYGADPVLHESHLRHFGVRRVDGRTLDFSHARTLLFFDNGIRDGAALRNIRTLLGLGYPARKLLWYRGGMSDWLLAGLPVSKGGLHGPE